MSQLIDLSHPIKDGMPVYPGDQALRLEQTKHLAVDGYNNHRLATGMHVGTHLDGRMHLTESSEYLCERPLDSFMGDGVVLDVRNQSVIEYRESYKARIHQGQIVLLYTGWSEKFGSEVYFREHPVIDLKFAQLLVDAGVTILGADLPSPDRQPFAVHKLLLDAGILILENLVNLESLLTVSRFEVWAFPLRIWADSSPVRAVARVLA